MARPMRPSERRPVPPSAAREAAKLEAEERVRLVLQITEQTRKNLKIKAAQEGLTIRAYIVELLRRDGVAVVE
jgi:predicted DNA binding CopG/RHH family protein